MESIKWRFVSNTCFGGWKCILKIVYVIRIGGSVFYCWLASPLSKYLQDTCIGRNIYSFLIEWTIMMNNESAIEDCVLLSKLFKRLVCRTN